MEPLGTITQYFPFIDEDTRKVLETKMKDADNYYDFVLRVVEWVLNSDSSDMLVYFATHHAILALDFKAIDQIREKYGERQILGPYLYFASAYQGNFEDLKKVHESANAILATQPGDLLTIEMNCMKFEASMVTYPQEMYDTSSLDTIREFIKKDSRFGFYETTLNDYLSRRAHTDGDSEERSRCIERGIKTAEKFNDKLRLGNLLYKKARIVQDKDRKQARELLKQAYDIIESLGNAVDYANIIEEMGKLEAIRGEFDSAIKRLLQAISIRERVDLDNSNTSLFLSTLSNIIGAPDSGLEWGRMAEIQFKSRPSLIPRAILNQAWSLILLRKLTEAQLLIDTISESVRKSGDETHLAWLHFVTGIMEIGEGDLLSAASSIEEALKIYENQRGAIMTQLIFLHHLAKIEVFSSDATTMVTPSLAILEEKALSEDLPGIYGQVLLLKAELYIIQDNDPNLRETIQQLQSLTEKESIQFLIPFFDSLLRRV
ncbi:MAG: hypothetical protein ACXADL_13035 [Candidatus Thorarchaeota archaeon]|jgi:tetratricopeptide (TPR) repeat protein